VSDPHGTHIASLISQVNPHCLLYCARVGKGRDDIKDSFAEQVSRSQLVGARYADGLIPVLIFSIQSDID
jgi:hypothetical protein